MRIVVGQYYIVNYVKSLGFVTRPSARRWNENWGGGSRFHYDIVDRVGATRAKSIFMAWPLGTIRRNVFFFNSYNKPYILMIG